MRWRRPEITPRRALAYLAVSCFALGILLPAIRLRPGDEILEVVPGLIQAFGAAFEFSVEARAGNIVDTWVMPNETTATSIAGAIFKVLADGLGGNSRSLVIGIVLCFFTLIFPVAKLTVVLVWLHSRWRPKGMVKLLVDAGKISMLDIYAIACFLLMTRGLGLVKLEVLAGVHLFAASVILTQLCKHLGKMADGVVPPPAVVNTKCRRSSIIVLLAATTLLLVGAQAECFRGVPPPLSLSLKTWILEPFSFSLFSGLAELGAGWISFLLIAFAFAPVVVRIVLLLHAATRAAPKGSALELSREWSMLDVFILSLLVVAAKGVAGYEIEVRIGVLLLTLGLFALDLAEDGLVRGGFRCLGMRLSLVTLALTLTLIASTWA